MNGRNPETVTFGPFRFVPDDGVWRDGQPVALPPRALAVLTALLATPGTVVSKQSLMDAAWPGTFVTDSSLLEAIGLLRDALGDDRKHPIYIQTVHRRGYRFIAAVDVEADSRIEPELSRLLASEGGPTLAPAAVPFFSGPEWRPIVVASATYALTTICVAIVFAIFGQEIPDRGLGRAAPPRFAISHTGTLVYVKSQPAARNLGVWEPAPAPRDSWLASQSGDVVSPTWTPSGLEIAFAFSKAGPFNLAGPWHQFPTSWSPDGRELAFTEFEPLTGADIWVFDRPTRTRRVLVRTTFDETWARFSPDGRWIAYMSNESGRWDVYVRASSGDGGRIRLSMDGGVWPSWSTDGGTVYFTAGSNTMASAIQTATGLAATAPAIVRRGGARERGRAELRIVLDWFSELAAHVRPS